MKMPSAACKKPSDWFNATLAKSLDIDDFEGVYGHSATFNTGQIGRGLTYFKKNYPNF